MTQKGVYASSFAYMKIKKENKTPLKKGISRDRKGRRMQCAHTEISQ